MTITIIDRFSGKSLFESDAESIAGAIKEAVAKGANLYGANLYGADLRSANLYGANLYGADLRSADLGKQWVIQGHSRSDGYPFFLQRLTDDKEPMIKAGCRYFTIHQAQEHWETTRKGEKLLDETRVIIRSMVDLMHIRGLS